MNEREATVLNLDLRIEVCGPVRTNMYVLINRAEGRAAVIDPAPESTPILNRLLRQANVTLATILITHRHFDHVGDAGPLAEMHKAAIVAHATDVEYLATPQTTRFIPGWVTPAAPVTDPVIEGTTIDVVGVPFVVLHTPGHAAGSVCLYNEASETLFSGDTLFAGTFGRYDLPGSDASDLRASLIRLGQLPGTTRVYPGHGGSTTIAAETWLADPPIR